ncbi:sialin-like [Clavelina lepadiformis]
MNRIEPSISSKTEESDEDEVTVKIPPGVGTWLSVRYSMAYLALLGVINVYALRVNLSVAIVSMVKYNSTLQTAYLNHRAECPGRTVETNHNLNTGEFDWNRNQQGLVLGAFFYGYIITQLPGGYLASKFGGKILFGGGVLCTAALTLLIPFAARTSFTALIVVRIFEGIGEGLTFPAMHSIWGSWAPPMESTRLTSITYAGIHLGTVLAQPISGMLCASNIMGGWPSVFYMFGAFGIIWCVFWFALAQNYPHECKWISNEELLYIQSNLKPAPSSAVPWKKIFSSKAVWAISIAHFCNNWGFYTLLTCLPTYLKDVLHFDIKQNGLIASLPYFVAWISCNTAALAADKIRVKRLLSTTATRKVFNTVSFVGPACFLIAAGYIGCDSVLAVTFICFATLFNGLAFSGFYVNHIDLSPHYAGILMGLTNTWATIPGFLSPLVVGVLTAENPGRKQWMYVFYISASVYIFGALCYILLGSGKEQKWNKTFTKNEEHEPLMDD